MCQISDLKCCLLFFCRLLEMWFGFVLLARAPTTYRASALSVVGLPGWLALF